MEENPGTHSLKFIMERFNLHTELREQYIRCRHSIIHPLIATIAAIESSKRVLISKEPVGKGKGEGDGEIGDLVCSICHEVFSIWEKAIELRCNHLFDTRCIFHWFVTRLSCQLCRYKLK